MKSFFHELRRRRVTRTAVVYALVAWAVIESSSVIFPALHLPEWTVTFVVVLALIGFPVTLVFSWLFDVTRGGVVRTPPRRESATEGPQAVSRGRWIDFVIIAVLVGVIGWLGWERVFDREPAPAAAALDSIAVLPFANLTGDPADEYFGDGLAEELLNALVQVDGLRVAARTSSFQYKGQHEDIRRIAEALGVSTVLEGSVRRAGDRVRITAQLIRAEDGFHLWSNTFDRRLEDIFAVQDEITLAIVDSLRVRLGARERERMTVRHTEDIEAFEAYLRGRFDMHRRTPAALNRAVEEFREAIRRDSGYAAAYSGLSDTWILLSSYGGVPAHEATRHAEPLARRALELDPELGEAHASWGLVLRSKGEVAGSLQPLRRAIELNPSYSPAYHWLSLSLSDAGRFEEAVEVMRKALEIDPRYATGKRALLGLLRNTGRDAEAAELARSLERDHGDDALVLYGLSADAMQYGDLLYAIRLAVRAVELQPDAVHIRQLLAAQLLLIGDVERADGQMEIAARHAPDAESVRLWPSQRAAMLGDADALVHAMEEFLAGTPESVHAEMMACDNFFSTGVHTHALTHCRRVLELLDWAPGDPLPPEGGPAGAFLMLAAAQTGEAELAAMLDPLVRQFIEQMIASGFDPKQGKMLLALMEMHRGDPEPFLQTMPEFFDTGNVNWRTLPANPLYAPVHDDPRFIAEVERLRERAHAIRAEVDRIEMPGS